jgi:hypothetical protein
MFTVVIDALTARITALLLQEQGGGPRQVSYWAWKLNPHERGNTYSAYDLKTLAVCEALKLWRCYLEGYSKFLIVIDHDALRHLRKQSNKRYGKLC